MNERVTHVRDNYVSQIAYFSIHFICLIYPIGSNTSAWVKYPRNAFLNFVNHQYFYVNAPNKILSSIHFI